MNLDTYITKYAGFKSLVKVLTSKSRKATLRKRSGINVSKARRKLLDNRKAFHLAETPKDAGVIGAKNEGLYDNITHHLKRTESLK